MKIFRNTPDSWVCKVNFVDANNTLVGYDLEQSCCERAGWYIDSTRRNDICDTNTTSEALDDYVFDREFLEQHSGDNVLDGGGLVRFRLTATGKPDLFLHLFNAHNGYYAHGFTVAHDGKIVESGHI